MDGATDFGHPPGRLHFLVHSGGKKHGRNQPRDARPAYMVLNHLLVVIGQRNRVGSDSGRGYMYLV